MAGFPEKAKVVIIGLGGIVGAAVAHHLIERGWDDIVGIEGFAEKTAEAVVTSLATIRQDFMQIYRLGTRMAMVMRTDDAVYDPERMRIATETDPAIQRWEALMWRFQAPTPWTPAGQKWIEATLIFDFARPPN